MPGKQRVKHKEGMYVLSLWKGASPNNREKMPVVVMEMSIAKKIRGIGKRELYVRL